MMPPCCLKRDAVLIWPSSDRRRATIYVDDSIENLRAAKKLGMRTVHIAGPNVRIRMPLPNATVTVKLLPLDFRARI